MNIQLGQCPSLVFDTAFFCRCLFPELPRISLELGRIVISLLHILRFRFYIIKLDNHY